MRTLLIIFFTLILNSQLSASFWELNEKEPTVVVKSFISGYKASFEEWPLTYHDFLGESCMSLVVPERLRQNIFAQKECGTLGGHMRHYMKIFFYDEKGATYITEENYWSVKTVSPKKCYLIGNGSEFPLLFFTALNRGPICMLSSFKRNRMIQMPETFSRFRERVSQALNIRVSDFNSVPDPRSCRDFFLNEYNYLRVYFSAAIRKAKKKKSPSKSYEEIDILCCEDESTTSSDGEEFFESSSDESSEEDSGEV